MSPSSASRPCFLQSHIPANLQTRKRTAISKRTPTTASLSCTRRQALSILLSTSISILPSVRTNASPQETDRVFFDVNLAGKPIGRITIALFGNDAPASVDTFTKLMEGNLRSRSGRTAGYQYSQGSKVIAGKRVELGRVKQIDQLNQQPGRPQRQEVVVRLPENRDDNRISHDQPGLVSVQRGGSFEFSIMLDSCPEMDNDHIVIGRVVDGMDVVKKLEKVPINQKTIRDGYRNIGKAIGDARANVDVRPGSLTSSSNITKQ